MVVVGNQSAVLDAIVVEHCEGNGCLPNASCANESNGLEIFSEFGDFLNQFVASEAGPGPRGRRFSQRDTTRCQTVQ